MKDKNLLNEGTIRRFMKLASLAPIAETFVSSNFQQVEEEEELEEISVGGGGASGSSIQGYSGKKEQEERIVNEVLNYLIKATPAQEQ